MDEEKVRRVTFSSADAKIEVFAKGGTSIITMTGRYSAKMSEKAMQVLTTIRGDVALEIVDLNPIDVSFLSFLRSMSRKVESRGGRFFLVNPPPRLRDMIQMSFSGDRFNIVDGVDELPDDGPKVQESPELQQTRHILSVRKDALQRMEWEKSFASARDRVRAFFPFEPPESDVFDLAFLYMPCDQIGGDFFDFIPLGDGRLGILIGDVSGHGIDAAVLVGLGKKVFEIWGRLLPSPKQVMVQCNDDISSELRRNAFVTSIYGVLDEQNLTFTFVRAGHTLPILFNPKRGILPQTVSSRGLGIGLAGREVFQNALEEQTIQLEDGDFLFFFTDGITEAQNPKGDEFGIKRLLDSLADVEPQTPQGAIRTVLRDLYSFTAPREQDDDITAICIGTIVE